MEMVRVVGQYDAERVSDENGLDCPEETLTDQSFLEETDINTIIDRFGIGENPIVPQEWVTSVDLSEAPDNYMDVMNKLNEARDQFMSLPAKVRSRFENDPHQFMEFVSDAGNAEEMVRLGLAEVRKAAPPSDTDRIVAALEKGRGTGST